MADQHSLRKITEARLRSAEALIVAEDWEGAAYMMGYALECAMKSVTCRVLNLAQYPKGGKDEDFFMTHRFDRLLIVSGLTDLFGSNGQGYAAWSAFTQEYPGEWTAMRYEQSGQFDGEKVKMLYEHLNGTTVGKEGLCKMLTIKQRW